MDVIKSFNQELQSLYETKPPISKAKITSITRSAIRAIKFYKHVVQSVEKFIVKCKTEYKVPGLYVIDSIVRQSRHQFPGKDVFGPRFSRNLKVTFQHLYQCNPEDKSKIIRVLNLWQKNEVFTPDVIHPLFDMADPNHPIHKELADIVARNGGVDNIVKPIFSKYSAGGVKSSPSSSNKHATETVSSTPTKTNSDLIQQLQHLQSLLQTHSGKDPQIKFDKKLLDFDYGEEEDEEKNQASAADALGSILNNPEVLRHLQNLQNQNQSQFNKIDFETLRKEQEMAIQEKEFDKHLAATLPKLAIASVCDFKPDDVSSSNAMFPHYNMQSTSVFPNMDLSVPPPGYPKKEQSDFDERVPFSQIQVQPNSHTAANTTAQPIVIDLDKIDSSSDSNDKSYRKRSHRSRSLSRGRRHRSRSDSRSRTRRRRSRSYDREEKVERYFDKDKEAERRKKALPPFKKNHLAVCSTTLWIGHLSKLVQEEELSDTFGEFGDVVSINLIPPRGCAFVCMNRRQDAAKALHKLKNTKLQGKVITLAWAPGKGMKDKDWKDFWEVQDGVSYIPYDRLSKDIDYDYLEDGGVFDEDTVPLWLKDHLKTVRKKQEDETQNDSETPTVSSTKADGVGPSSSEGSLPTVFIPLPDGPLPNSTNTDGTDKNNVSSISLPMTATPSVSQAGTQSTGAVSGIAGPHLLMPPFGIPRLLGPMGMTMGPAGLMSNVSLGVPPPGLSMMHQQLLNRMPPPVNSFNQNLDGILPLPFGLQHLQSTLQPGAVNQTLMNMEVNDKENAEKKSLALNDSLLNVLGGAGNHPFSHLGGQYSSLPLMSVPPPTIIPTSSVSTTIQNLSVPPPKIIDKNIKGDQNQSGDDYDNDVVMEDTETNFPAKSEDEKKDKKVDKDRDRRDRERDSHRDKDKGRDRERDRDRDRYHKERDRDKYREREKSDRESRDRWGGRNNRGRGNSNTPQRRDSDITRENRSSRWGEDNQNKDTSEDKPKEDSSNWAAKSANNNGNTNDPNIGNNVNDKPRDDITSHPPPLYLAPPPTGPHLQNNLSGPGLMRPLHPPFMRHPGPPHMFGPRNNMEGFRARFDSMPPPTNDQERFPFETHFPAGNRKEIDNHPPHLDAMNNFRLPDNFGPRGPPPRFPRGAPDFGPRGPPPDFGPRGPPPNGFCPRGIPPDFGTRPPQADNFGPRGPPPPFDRPDLHPDFHGTNGPRPLLGPRGSPRPMVGRGPGLPGMGQFGPNPLAFRGSPAIMMRLPRGMMPPTPPPNMLVRGPLPMNHQPNGQDFDNRRKTQWRDRSFDEDNRNRRNDIESRPKRSRWENNEESAGKGERDDENNESEFQVSSLTNPSNEASFTENVSFSTNEENNPEPIARKESPNESLHLKPLSMGTNQSELPTQGPGEINECLQTSGNEKFIRDEDKPIQPVNEEYVCDSTVD